MKIFGARKSTHFTFTFAGKCHQIHRDERQFLLLLLLCSVFESRQCVSLSRAFSCFRNVIYEFTVNALVNHLADDFELCPYVIISTIDYMVNVVTQSATDRKFLLSQKQKTKKN